MTVIDRVLKSRVMDALQDSPAVYINGPRQAGKTTFVKKLLVPNFKADYITFDNALTRVAAMRNPISFLQESGCPLIIDEVQRVPDLFRPLKMRIDESRQEALSEGGRCAGLYLLTGSANLLAQPALADAMVGRMMTRTLLPLSSAEIMGQQSHFIERCFNRDFSGVKVDSNLSLLEAIRKSTFPEIVNMSDRSIDDWFMEYVEKITLDDPRQIYRLEKAEYMPMLVQALAARAGNLINDANIGREIGLNAVTTRNYRTLLDSTFVTHALKPWYRNMTKRLMKARKQYFYDTMLLCYLMGTTPGELMKAHPQRFGHVLENYVFTELMKANNAGGHRVNISYYRTHDDREVDFVLERKQQLVAIEVKHAEHITARDIAGMLELQRETGEDFCCGVVLCNTPRVLAFDENIYLVPFSALWQ